MQGFRRRLTHDTEVPRVILGAGAFGPSPLPRNPQGLGQALAPPLRGAPTSRPGLPTASRRGPARQPALAITGKAGGLSGWARRHLTPRQTFSPARLMYTKQLQNYSILNATIFQFPDNLSSFANRTKFKRSIKNQSKQNFRAIQTLNKTRTKTIKTGNINNNLTPCLKKIASKKKEQNINNRTNNNS